MFDVRLARALAVPTKRAFLGATLLGAACLGLPL